MGLFYFISRIFILCRPDVPQNFIEERGASRRVPRKIQDTKIKHHKKKKNKETRKKKKKIKTPEIKHMSKNLGGSKKISRYGGRVCRK